MDIIVVSGVGNSGKTGSIKHAIKLILEAYETEILYVSCFRANKRNLTNKQYLIDHILTSIEIGLDKDRNITLVILKIKDITFGFTTYGDSPKEIQEIFKTALNETHNKLDVFVCARHDKNDICIELSDYASNPTVDIIRSKKSKSSDSSIRDKENLEKGKQIVQHINKIIRNMGKIQ